MGKHVAGGCFRFLSFMRAPRILFALGLLAILINPPAHAQFKAWGYFAFQYEKGGSQSDFPKGTFGGTQAGLLISGQRGNLFFYGLEIRLKSETEVRLEEAWAALQPSPAFGLKLGLYLVPFGKYNRSNRPHETRLIEPPLHLEALYPASWRDVGLLMEGRFGILNYSGCLGNGLAEADDLRSSQQFKDNNSEKAMGGRVGVFLSPSFEVGGSYYRGKYDDANRRNLILQGADITWDNDTFLFSYEYGKALIGNPEEYRRGESEGHFLLFCLKIGGFSPLASYQKLRIDDPYHGPGFEPGVSPGSGLSSRCSRWAFGLTYAPDPDLLIKLEYDLNKEAEGELKNDVFLVQLALQWK